MSFMAARMRRRRALGTTAIEYGYPTPPPPPPPPPKVVRAGRGMVARSRGRLAFGDDEMSDADWRAAMLEQQTNVAKWQEQWVKRDEMQRWIQIAATLAIPLSTAIWKAIFRSTRE